MVTYMNFMTAFLPFLSYLSVFITCLHVPFRLLFFMKCHFFACLYLSDGAR